MAWLPIAFGTLALSAHVGARPASTSSRTITAIEGVSVAAIVALSLAVVAWLVLGAFVLRGERQTLEASARASD